MIMRPTLSRRRAAQLLAGAALAGCAPRERPTAPSHFQGLLADWTRTILTDDPEAATAAGLGAADIGAAVEDRLTDRSEAAVARRRTAALRRQVELRALDASALTQKERETHAVVTHHFEQAAQAAQFEFGAFSALGGAQPYALDQLGAAFITVPDFLDSRQPLPDLADAEAYLARIGGFGAALAAQAAHARAEAQRGYVPPAGVVLSALGAAEALAATPAEAQALYQGFARKIDALVPPAADATTQSPEQRRAVALKAQALTLVRERALPGFARTAETLRWLAPAAPANQGVWRLPDGEAYYATLLRLETSTNLTPAEVHQIGLERVAEVSEVLDAALRRLGLTVGTVGERMAGVTADPAHQYPNTDEGKVQLLADVQARVARIQRDAGAWFGAMPRAALEVRAVPAAAEAGSSGGYYQPPSIDGTQPGIYYLNLRNTAELTRIDLPTQDYHEAIPGHHLQVALALEQENRPLLQKLMTFNSYGEGWGLYAEQLADEQGYYNSDPIGRLGYLRWQLWRAARLVVDTGIHAQRWEREQAIAYLVQTTGDLRAVVETEVDRYAAIPGQACSYELGRREIVRLREGARRSLGAAFTLRDFHDQVLLAGEAPLGLLAQRIETWAAAAG
jgi:uncharacterized protein (DUF885 family)